MKTMVRHGTDLALNGETMLRKSSPRRRRAEGTAGFTLVEVVVSMLIVGGLFAAALTAVGAAKAGRIRLADRARAAALADAVMSEVLAQPIGEIADDTSGSGHGLLPGADHAGLSYAVHVDWVVPDQPDQRSATPTGVKRIVVTVRRAEAGMVLARLTALRTDAWPTLSNLYESTYPEGG